MIDSIEAHRDRAPRAARYLFAGSLDEAGLFPDALEDFGARRGRDQSFIHHLVQRGLNGQHDKGGRRLNTGPKLGNVLFQSGDAFPIGEHAESPFVGGVAVPTIAAVGGAASLSPKAGGAA